MKRNIFFKILIGAGILIVLTKIATVAFVEPWLKQKIQSAFNENNTDYIAEIGEANILFLRSGIQMIGILDLLIAKGIRNGFCSIIRQSPKCQELKAVFNRKYECKHS